MSSKILMIEKNSKGEFERDNKWRSLDNVRRHFKGDPDIEIVVDTPNEFTIKYITSSERYIEGDHDDYYEEGDMLIYRVRVPEIDEDGNVI